MAFGARMPWKKAKNDKRPVTCLFFEQAPGQSLTFVPELLKRLKLLKPFFLRFLDNILFQRYREQYGSITDAVPGAAIKREVP